MIVYPFKAKDDATAESARLAGIAFINLLLGDARVERAYMYWRATSRVGALAGKQDALVGDFLDAVGGARDDLRKEILPALVERLMSRAVPLESRGAYLWVVDALWWGFFVRIVNEVIPGGDFRVSTDVVRFGEAAKGRRAKAGGESIGRGVEWFYRVHVQEPPETLSALGRALGRERDSEGQTRAKSWSSATSGRSTVEAGIARARVLLGFPPLPK
jgi:hypothetical protein